MRSPTDGQCLSCLKHRLLALVVVLATAGGCALPGRSGVPLATSVKPNDANLAADTVTRLSTLEDSVAPVPQTSGETDSIFGDVQAVAFEQGIGNDNSATVIVAPINPAFASFVQQDDDSDDDSDPDESDSEQASEADAKDDEALSPSDLVAMSAGTVQSVDYFISIALSQHPGIQAARQRVAAATNVIPQVRSLPDPVFSNNFSPIRSQALQTAGGRVANQMSLTQGVPWPEKLRTKATIASREVQIAQVEVDRIEREITEAVQLAYYEVWYATRAIKIIDETRDLVDDLTRVAEARYRSGGSQQDVLRAQLESDRLDDQIITLTKQKQVAQADLATLLQQPVLLIPETAEEIGLSNVPQQLDQLIASAEQCSPELRGLVWEIQRDRDKQRLARLEKYPDLQVGVNLAILSDGRDVLSGVADGRDAFGVIIGTTLPIWRNKINAGIREAAHRTSSTVQRHEAERDTIYGKLRRLLAQADSLVEQTNIYENRIIPRTEDTLKLSIADYRGERADFFALIETYRELLMFETQLARFSASLAGTIAQIDRIVGCSTIAK